MSRRKLGATVVWRRRLCVERRKHKASRSVATKQLFGTISPTIRPVSFGDRVHLQKRTRVSLERPNMFLTKEERLPSFFSVCYSVLPRIIKWTDKGNCSGTEKWFLIWCPSAMGWTALIGAADEMKRERYKKRANKRWKRMMTGNHIVFLGNPIHQRVALRFLIFHFFLLF